jgi:hypothetical protein
MIYFEVNEIKDQEEFLEIIEKTNLDVQSINKENVLMYQIKLYKINDTTGKKWPITISIHFDDDIDVLKKRTKKNLLNYYLI